MILLQYHKEEITVSELVVEPEIVTNEVVCMCKYKIFLFCHFENHKILALKSTIKFS
jgi:hypothetical protein